MAKLQSLLVAPNFQAAQSDDRFEMLVGELTRKPENAPANEYEWKPKSGERIRGKIKSAGQSFTLALKTADAPAFGDFISRRLDELYEAYRSEKLKQAGE